jgi:putative endonuclease
MRPIKFGKIFDDRSAQSFCCTMPSQALWFLYIIRCADNSLYTGITTDLARRFAEHQAQGKKCAKYLRGKAPLELVFQTIAGNKAQASRLELRLKQCSKRTKERLVAGETTLVSLGLIDPTPSDRVVVLSEIEEDTI